MGPSVHLIKMTNFAMDTILGKGLTHAQMNANQSPNAFVTRDVMYARVVVPMVKLHSLIAVALSFIHPHNLPYMLHYNRS